jgi:hypothetical protein
MEVRTDNLLIRKHPVIMQSKPFLIPLLPRSLFRLNIPKKFTTKARKEHERALARLKPGCNSSILGRLLALGRATLVQYATCGCLVLAGEEIRPLVYLYVIRGMFRHASPPEEFPRQCPYSRLSTRYSILPTLHYLLDILYLYTIPSTLYPILYTLYSILVAKKILPPRRRRNTSAH